MKTVFLHRIEWPAGARPAAPTRLQREASAHLPLAVICTSVYNRSQQRHSPLVIETLLPIPTGQDKGNEAMRIPATESLAGTVSSWHALGPGLNDYVNAIAVAGPDVYVGGAFTDAGGDDNADYLTRWDGTSWHAVGSGGAIPSLSSWVRAIMTVGAWVGIGGAFTDAGGNLEADHIAAWDGSIWHAFVPGLNDWVRSIVMVGPDVCVGGEFTDAGGLENGDFIARWGTVFSCVYLPLLTRSY